MNKPNKLTDDQKKAKNAAVEAAVDAMLAYEDASNPFESAANGDEGASGEDKEF